MDVSQNTSLPMTSSEADGLTQLRNSRVLLVGLGNIGSVLAVLLAHLVASIRLVDRDIVEPHNVENQFYGPEHVGQSKAAVTAQRLAEIAPGLDIAHHVTTLEDLPRGYFAETDVVLAGLDSLGGRQKLSEQVYPLQIPYIDGAVGDPFDIRVQVLLPNSACLECSWGPAQYRELATEYPCRPGATAEGPRTNAPASAGAATASLMVAQCARLLGHNPPEESYEIIGNLFAGRVTTVRRNRNPKCRYPHPDAPQLISLPTPFTNATIADLLSTTENALGGESVQFEFRRGVLGADLFHDDCLASWSQLRRLSEVSLGELGLTPHDRVVARRDDAPMTAHVCFQQ